METLLAQVEALLSREAWIWFGLFSIVFFVVTLAAIPFILVRLPPHYFDERHPRLWMSKRNPVLRVVGFVVKNAVGAVFLLIGIALLFLPGQGVLTILIGVSLLDFPGKRSLERKIISQPAVLSAINALRAKFDKSPMTVKDGP